ncbi:MAG: GNAT family N-acetyltransferase [Brevundimonas sp.]|uniref:GNAT family N-acetyltransferase n=1 Tax=Brevundimonas sp. TaxID=1871086 RepID=UPI00391D389D
MKTLRLHLRPYGVSDVPACLALWQEPDVVRFIGGRALTPEDVWARLYRHTGHHGIHGFGFGAVMEGERYGGEAGFAFNQRGLGERFDGAPEVGWALNAGSRGRGLGRELVEGLCAEADGRWQAGDDRFSRLVCLIEPTNAPSLHLAVRAGFVPFGEASYKGAQVQLFERTAGAASPPI